MDGPVSGWLQLVVQGGALGLLFLLLWRLPKMMGDLRAEREGALAAYRDEMRQERDTCTKRFDRLADLGEANAKATQQALGKVGEAIEGVKAIVAQHERSTRATVATMATLPPSQQSGSG